MSADQRGHGSPGDGTSVGGSPTHRVEYTDASGGQVSETAYSATSAEVKAEIAEQGGATGISIEPFNHGR